MLDNLPALNRSGSREAIRLAACLPEDEVCRRLQAEAQLPASSLADIRRRARAFVLSIRERQRGRGGIGALLQEFSLTSDEGIVLMCLAEALLRIPDAATQDRMIRDRLNSGDWSAHLGHSHSLFVNASAWGLLLTGRVMQLPEAEGPNLLAATVRRLGEPVIRSAMRYAMQIMGEQFVMGRDIEAALARAARNESLGYTYSYDMLGEGARTMDDADRYFERYLHGISAIGAAGSRERPSGISVKLSALHPRYELKQHHRVLSELTPRLMRLVQAARRHGIGLTVDAEESYRLDLALEVVERIFLDDALENWGGFGLAVQAYHKHGSKVVAWAIALARQAGRRLGVRLVKGAYWDTEIKLAQVMGYDGYPVFTGKPLTDLSYQACARQLMANRQVVYPQFATHNAYTVATVLALEALSGQNGGYEFQRLHGMGEELYDGLVKQGAACRIYAPVGEHSDLLAYLVRRLLENGANTSFVNNIQNREAPIADILADPVAEATGWQPGLPLPANIYRPHRLNSAGIDIDDYRQLLALRAQLEPGRPEGADAGQPVRNPADPEDLVGHVRFDTPETMLARLQEVTRGRAGWAARDDRPQVLRRVADHLERDRSRYIALCIREAGKTLEDSIAEIREAVDFCRYYAAEAEQAGRLAEPCGTFVCISPWNFPLAIFVGQVSAALVAGNTVLAKPAEQTSLTAGRVVAAMHACGVPETALQLVLSEGAPVSAVLLADPRVSGVMFTGSTATAKRIAGVLNDRREGQIPLVAETGGVNAMIVDSTALPEQVADDVIDSAFRSAGQRCSALRMLYLQDEVAEPMLAKIVGKMAELVVADPARYTTDVGPIIDRAALGRLHDHIKRLETSGARCAYRCSVPATKGFYFGPAAYELPPSMTLDEEVFGPILHIKRFRAGELDRVLEEINASGFGLTLGVHSRIESRTAAIGDLARVGNVYVNRNMIGAVVGVQPFGGRGRSGTGPKAGGPNYLPRLTGQRHFCATGAAAPGMIVTATRLHAGPAINRWCALSLDERIREVRRFLQEATGGELPKGFDRLCGRARACCAPLTLPSPTGESNTLHAAPRGLLSMHVEKWHADHLLCMAAALLAGNGIVVSGDTAALRPGPKVAAGKVIYQSERLELAADGVVIAPDCGWYPLLQARLLEARQELVPVIPASDNPLAYLTEKTISIDTTAAGGNASLLAGNT